MAKILIVDDEEGVRSILRRLLEKNGHECSVASDINQARGLLKEQSFDLLLSDIKMPGESGLVLVHEVTRDFPEMATILLTGVDDPDVATDALKAGVYGYIVKPFQHSQVLISVINAFRRKDLEKEARAHQVTLEKTVEEKTAQLKERLNRLEATQKALQESEERYRMAIELSNDGVTIIQRGRIAYANQKWASIQGYGHPDEVIGKPITLFVHPDEFEQVTDILGKRDRGEDAPSKHEAHCIRKDGKSVFIEISATRIIYRGAPCTLSFVRDVTERKKAEEALSKKTKELDDNRNRLQNALEEISSLIQRVAREKDFGIRFRNSNVVKCYESLGCKKEDCPCFGRDAMRCWQTVGTFCHGKKQGSFAHKVENCSQCPVFQTCCPDSYSQIGEHFNNMMHILEAKNLELLHTNQELKTSQSQIIQQEKMASIGQLAAGVAHEINNPTGFISSNLKTLEGYLQDLFGSLKVHRQLVKMFAQAGNGVIPDSLAQAIEKVQTMESEKDIDFVMNDVPDLLKESREGTERIKKIVVDLKDFAHPGTAELVHADINKNLDSTLNIVWNELKYKAKVSKEYGQLPEVECYPQQLNQVFMNILVNAAHAIEKQGEIKIGTKAENGQVFVAISDTGIGIPKENLARIFEPFFTTKEVGKGTGLGLHVAYNIIKKHKGDIHVESTPGKGTIFTVEIPINAV